jgi:hypothetical protein
MERVWGFASVWVGLALMTTLFAIWLAISTTLSEIFSRASTCGNGHEIA